MAPDSVAATIYAVCRDELMRLIMEPVLGPLARALGGSLYGTLMPLGQLQGRLLTMMQADDRTLLPAGETWASLTGERPAADDGVAAGVGRRSAGLAVGTPACLPPRHPLVAEFPALAGG